MTTAATQLLGLLGHPVRHTRSPDLHTAALAAGVVQRAHVFVAPRILGGAEGPRLVGDLGFRKVADGFHLEDVQVEVLGEDVLFTGNVACGRREEG